MEAVSRVLLPPSTCSRGRKAEESMKVFREGIDLAINRCLAFQYNVRGGYFGSQPSPRIHNLFETIFSLFIRSKDPPTKIQLIRQLNPSYPHPGSFDKSIEEVSDQLLAMYQECLRGDFSSIQIIKEANAHRLMWKQVNKFELENNPVCEEVLKANLIRYDSMWRRKDRRQALKANSFETDDSKMLQGDLMNLKVNSSEIDGSKVPQEDLMNLKTNNNSSKIDDSKVLQGDSMNLKANSSEIDDSRMLQGDSMRVFKEGVSLLMDNLWLRHVFMEEECGSNPSLVLQYLADIILFWFTQTIKPVSLVYIEWILKYEMFFLPVDENYYGITKEVAKKLMVMYEECLQGNFSSVEILREENLSWESSSDETIVTHRPGYGTHTRWVRNMTSNTKRREK